MVHIETLHNPEMLSDTSQNHKLMTISWAQAPAFNPDLVNRKSTIIKFVQVKAEGIEIQPSHTQPNNNDEVPTTTPETNEKTPDRTE